MHPTDSSVLALSAERALQFTPDGSLQFEIPLEGAGASIALHHPNYAVVVKGDNVYVVRNRNKQHFNVYIEDAKFTPLTLF